MASPFDGFTQGLMTGGQLGRGIREQGQRREIGGLMTAGNLTGARDAAYGQGNLELGGQLDARVRAQATQAREQGVGTALAAGNYDEATRAAGGDVQLLGQIRQWKSQATADEVTAANAKFTNLAALAEAIGSVPDPQERLRIATQMAPMLGINPAEITPEALTDQALSAIRVRAMGLANALAYEDRQADNRRQDEQFAETQRHNRATEGVAASREARVGRGRPSGSRPAPSNAPARGFDASAIKWD